MESVSSDGERKPQPAEPGGANRELPDGVAAGNTERTGETEVKPATEAVAPEAQPVAAEPRPVAAETQAVPADTRVVPAETQAAVGGGPAQSSDERTWAMVTHLSALAGYAIPFGHVFGPLLVWILKRETLPAVDEHGKESLNFQLSCTIYAVVSLILIVVGIGILLLLAVAVFDLVFIIIAAVKAYNGESYRYPLTIRFIK
jgi:uncharacterized Tic20 family protein